LERLQDLKSELEKQYPNQLIHPIALDVRSREAVNGAIAALPSELKSIDVLVNNAGLVIGLDKLADVTEDAIDTMLDTNIKGLVFVTQAVLPGMKEQQKGHIINVGSVSGEHNEYKLT
jgi:3-hydroxy acid dehydrogenase/malonic semialdehyde reductase